MLALKNTNLATLQKFDMIEKKKTDTGIGISDPNHFDAWL